MTLFTNSGEWAQMQAAKMGMTVAQYEAWLDVSDAYPFPQYVDESCQCEAEGGYGDDGSGTRRGISPNYRCPVHRMNDWQDRHEVTRTIYTWYEFWLNRILILWTTRDPDGWADNWAQQKDIELGAAL